jgi:hypothetical protein
MEKTKVIVKKFSERCSIYNDKVINNSLDVVNSERGNK